MKRIQLIEIANPQIGECCVYAEQFRAPFIPAQNLCPYLLESLVNTGIDKLRVDLFPGWTRPYITAGEYICILSENISIHINAPSPQGASSKTNPSRLAQETWAGPIPDRRGSLRKHDFFFQTQMHTPVVKCVPPHLKVFHPRSVEPPVLHHAQ